MRFPNQKPLRLVLLAVVTLFLSSVAGAHAAGESVNIQFDSTAYAPLYFVLAAAIAALIYGLVLRTQVMKLSPGTKEMQQVGQAIREGALAYLSKQVRTMLPVVILLFIILFFLFRYQPGYTLGTAIGVAVAFIFGVGCSYAAGYIGMGMATHGNQRTANAALTSYKGALEAAFRSGAVAGLMTVGLGLLGATIIFFIFKGDAMKVLVGFGFGGSLAALFMRVGGGIFTKAADVGADLVGKVEQNIPEDDPRNAATIADNVGDNVGDCAGMAADVFESYEVTLVAAIILGVAVGAVTNSPAAALGLILFPLLVHAVGIIASIIGIASVRGKEDINIDPLAIISRGLWTTAAIAVIGFGIVAFTLPQWKDGVTITGADGIQHTYAVWQFFACTLLGVVLALVISFLTEYFTGSDKGPVTETALAAKTGPATLILSGFSLGLESATWGAVAIAVALFVALMIFHGDPLLTAYGIALAGLGLLTTTGYVLAMDTFGPISDNANGIFEMSGALKTQSAGNGKSPGHISGDKVVARLDSAGNTTKALTKGFAIATAVIAAVALFRSFVHDTALPGLPLDQPQVFIGLLIGGAAPFLFSSFAINAVSRAATGLVLEVRRQFREMPGIMEGTQTPDYARCVAISTAAAQKELLGPGILAICLPILVGFGFGFGNPQNGALALGGYLAGAIVSGQLMAVLLANSGGAWDNAKKKIEDGMLGGKGSEAHKAGVIGDTVGDPFKDTAGPALNPLIKVMNLVAVLIAGVIVGQVPTAVRAGVVVVTAVLLVIAIVFSKRSTLIAEDDMDALPLTSDESAALAKGRLEETKR
ncbi:MAG TPA: sodium-translocating pyrophosphatase [Capsulimonadaceae bacterium]|nr:sodium-translocating pyrophosphatase [Capsulimonadaceae bacterium]